MDRAVKRCSRRWCARHTLRSRPLRPLPGGIQTLVASPWW